MFLSQIENGGSLPQVGWAAPPRCQVASSLIFKLLVDLASLGCVEWCVRAAATWICQLATSTCVHAPDKQIACTRLALKPLTLKPPSLHYRRGAQNVAQLGFWQGTWKNCSPYFLYKAKYVIKNVNSEHH